MGAAAALRVGGEGVAEARDPSRRLGREQRGRLVLHAPHRPARLGIAGEARDQVPVDVGDLIAEQLVVHLHRLIDLCEGVRHATDVLDHPGALRRRQVVELGGVAPQDHEHPPGKELIRVQVCPARVEVGDEEIALARDALAELAGGRAHGARSARKRPRRASASSMRSIEFA